MCQGREREKNANLVEMPMIFEGIQGEKKVKEVFPAAQALQCGNGKSAGQNTGYTIFKTHTYNGQKQRHLAYFLQQFFQMHSLYLMLLVTCAAHHLIIMSHYRLRNHVTSLSIPTSEYRYTDKALR